MRRRVHVCVCVRARGGLTVRMTAPVHFDMFAHACTHTLTHAHGAHTRAHAPSKCPDTSAAPSDEKRSAWHDEPYICRGGVV